MEIPKKLIIFDIDGTLTNSVTLYHSVVARCLNLMGIKDVDTNFSGYKYHTDSYGLKWNYENNFNKPFDKDLLNVFEDLIYKELTKHPPVSEIKSAKDCVNELLDANFAIAFATGSLLRPAKLKLDQCKIWYKEGLIATSSISFDREAFVLQAIENAKKYFSIEEFDQIYSVGDGVWDLETANKLGLTFIGIGKPHKEKLIAKGCSVHFDDLSQLAPYLI
jgi:phosphoglycolate phosphatase-like HAD superfamily hydrolase